MGEAMNGEATILWVETSQFPRDWGIKNHAHQDYYHLFYFFSGNGTFLIEHKPFPIVPGSFFLLPPWTVHGLENAEVDDLGAYEIKCSIQDPSLLQQMSSGPVVITEHGGFIESSFKYLLKYGLSRDPEHSRRNIYMLCALFSYLSDQTAASIPENSELINTSSYSPATIRILTYIESNYMNHIYLDDIAEHIEYNRNYMCSLFKSDTGITIVDYLNFVRIRKACEYILYSDIDLSKICYRVGFPNLSHFHRTFKKFVGMTPTAYSKMENLEDHHLFAGSDGSGSGFPSLEEALAAIRAGD